MQRRALGTTDIQVSILGLGTVKFGRNTGVRYPQAFTLPTDAALANLLSRAHALGINLLDTAPAYGNSEERIGKLIVHHRHQWVVTTKVGEEFHEGQSHFDFSKAAIQKSIARSLKRLRTDYLDAVLVHSSGEDIKIIEQYDVFSTLAEIKKNGWIRAYGMSTKSVAGGLLAVDQADVVMVTLNLIQTEEQVVIHTAHQKKKGVLIKKALASGHMQAMRTDHTVQNTLKYILEEPG